jgi:hypothetical protein
MVADAKEPTARKDEMNCMIGRVSNAVVAVASRNILVNSGQQDVTVFIVKVRFTNGRAF